jgi:hypothetical protein
MYVQRVCESHIRDLLAVMNSEAEKKQMELHVMLFHSLFPGAYQILLVLYHGPNMHKKCNHGSRKPRRGNWRLFR